MWRNEHRHKTATRTDYWFIKRRKNNAEIVGVEQTANGVVICLEKIYFRNKSYAALTVIIQNEGTESKAAIIGSGGGEKRCRIISD